MKKHLNKLFPTILLGCMSLLTWGQTDMTHLITNPDFEEEGITGWKTTGIGPQPNSSFHETR